MLRRPMSKTIPSVDPLRRRSAGFSLVEVLVTVAIVAIALVGIAATQLVGLRGNQGAYYVTQATYAAYEMADLLRASRGGVLGMSPSALMPAVAAWRDHVRNLLPDGDLQVAVVNPARSEVRIAVSWLDEKQATGPTGGRQGFVLVTRI